MTSVVIDNLFTVERKTEKIKIQLKTQLSSMVNVDLKTIPTSVAKISLKLTEPNDFDALITDNYQMKVLMFDGTTKSMKDVQVGDQLMGDDSQPRNVLSLVNRTEQLYRIQPIKGDAIICGLSSILTFMSSTNMNRIYTKGSLHDFSISDFLKLPTTFHSRGTPLRLVKTGITYTSKSVDLDPYMIGYWLGDGTTIKANQITTTNFEVVDYFRQTALKKYGLNLKQLTCNGKLTITYDIINSIIDPFTDKWLSQKARSNYFTETMKKYNLVGNKHIPPAYKFNSRAIQLELLAGLIDSDGYLDKLTSYDFTLKSEKLFDDMVDLCRSLGFVAYKSIVQKTCTNSESNWAVRDHPDDKFGRVIGTYYQCCISGIHLNQIPVKLAYKKAQPRKQIKNPLVVGFKPIPLNIGNVCDFIVDGNHRYLMNDYTIIHDALQIN